MSTKSIGVALVGCGTVGGATAKIIVDNTAKIAARSGVELQLLHIVDRSYARADELGITEGARTSDLAVVCADPNVDVVLELVGGLTTAKSIIEQALRAGKHVVTANKALLAHHGAELLALAADNGVCIGFEASCGGGIPIIRALYDGLAANHIDAIYGIVNGTCNYILTEMIHNGADYPTALAQAQKAGLAEADPTLDVSGVDSAHKIAIMASLAFGVNIEFASIPVSGIDSLDLKDVLYAARLGYSVKLLAIADRRDNGVMLRVRPAFIAKEHPLAWVSGPFNAVSVYGNTTGHTMYYGRGAGGMPTGSAVVADIISLALGSIPAVYRSSPALRGGAKEVAVIPVSELESRYYLRIMVADSPGALADITGIFGRYGISIASVHQDEPTDSDNGGSTAPVPVVVVLHTAKEQDVLAARDNINALESTAEVSSVIAIVDEHEEGIATH
ncbi:MAG: homoserine dehydrogenase [Spirochaetia bacterium]